MATRDEIKKLSCSELRSHLMDVLGDDVSPSVFDTLEEERVSGRSFLEMGDDELREIASHLGDRMTLKRYINSFKMASTKVHRLTDKAASLYAFYQVWWLH